MGQHSADSLFNIHTENLKSVQAAFEGSASAARDAIRDGDTGQERSFTRTAAFLLGSSLELRLNCVITEAGGFSADEAALVRRGSEADGWQTAIDLGFRSRHNVWELSEASLGSEAANQRSTLQTEFVKYLEPVILIRNKLAHGQWVTALNSGELAENRETTALIESQTIQEISIKNRLSRWYAKLILDLVSTRDAFERDFNSIYANFCACAKSLDEVNEESYRAEIVRRFEDGKKARLSRQPVGG